MNILDKETKEQISDAEEVANLLSSRGWGVIKPKLDERILDVQNINNLITDGTISLETQILGRKLAAELIFIWLKSDVYGFVEQQRAAAESLVDRPLSGHIVQD